MTRPPTTRYAPAAAVLFTAVLLATTLVGTALLSAAACSSSDSQTDAIVSATTLRDMTAEELAGAVTDTYAEAMQELVALLEDKPDVETALPQVQALREDYIQEMLALGHQRELLNDSEKEQANSMEMSALMAMADETWYQAYDPIWQYYHEIDLDLANLIASFHTLTQYSDFELLLQQSPAEAERLGVGQPQ
jgi:succinate dehydrogenase/fumarate reductase flavoprotein subunit